MAWMSTDVSPRSISSVTGTRSRYAVSAASWSKPISASCSPCVYEWMPMRCRELIAFGLVNRMRSCSSRRITPSATRGASSSWTSSRGTGTMPSVIMRANRSNVSRYAAFELALRRPEVVGDSRLTTAIGSPVEHQGDALGAGPLR